MPVKILLQEIRKSRGLSQNELARLASMSPQNIQRIEQGEAKSLTFKALEQFCQVLNCQPGDILVYEATPDSASASTEKPLQKKNQKTRSQGTKDSTFTDCNFHEQMVFIS
jgi:putative transcriptional regulator